MADTIVTLRLNTEVCRWNRNYFCVEQHESVKCFNFIKPLTDVARIGFPLYGNASLSCIDFFHQKDLIS